MTMTIEQPSNGGALAVNDPQQQPQQQALAVQTQRRESIIVEDSQIALLDTGKFNQMQRAASAMARSSLVPDHLALDRNKQPLHYDVVQANCFRIVNQAMRWGFDPFSIIDETFLVGGKLGYSGKLIAAVVNSRANLVGRLRYEFNGQQGDNLAVTVFGRFQGEAEERTVDLSVGKAKTSNQMWTKDPAQKLIYSAVVKWARRYCPEVVLGVLLEDEELPKPELAGPAQAAADAPTLQERVNQLRKRPTASPTAPKPDPAASIGGSLGAPGTGESFNTDTGEVTADPDAQIGGEDNASQPEAPTEDSQITPQERWQNELQEMREAVGMEQKAFDKGVKKFLVAKSKVGKGWTLTADERKELVALATRKFN